MYTINSQSRITTQNKVKEIFMVSQFSHVISFSQFSYKKSIED